MSDDILDELNASFVSPDREFLGQRLAPYTEGSRLLLLQVRDENDSSIWFVWAFVFLHILLAKDRKEAIKVAWNKELFRERLLDWVAEKTVAERDMATALVSKIIEEASMAKVDVIQGQKEAKGGKA
jgi:hypothetical protein